MKRLPLAAAITATLTIGIGVAAAPAALADNPTPLPSQVTAVVAAAGLPVQVDNGWEAVTGPAATIDYIRGLATGLGVGNVVAYTGNYETDQAVMIFTGNDDNTIPPSFQLNGNQPFLSVANGTDQNWFIFGAAPGLATSVVPPGMSENVAGGGSVLSTIGLTAAGFTPTSFDF